MLGALLLAGTFVTAAGPHSGDADTPRLAAGVPAMAQLHADLLFGYLGLLVGLGFALRAVAAPAGAAAALRGAGGGGRSRRASRRACSTRWGCPRRWSSLHVLGAALVTVAAAAVWTGTAQRGPAESPPARLVRGPAPAPAGARAGRADRPALVERS